METDIIPNSFFSEKDKPEIKDNQNSLFVFIADESAIDAAFKALKSKLIDRACNCLTFIYIVEDQSSEALFQTELECLEKRFPQKLQFHPIKNLKHFTSDNSELYQRFLEVEINCNTCEHIQFLIFGDSELKETVGDRLHFLGIQASQILF